MFRQAWIAIAMACIHAEEAPRSLLSSQIPGNSADAPLTVLTAHGPVKGFYQGDARSFLGIPFAAAPVGNLRFALPISPTRWNQTLDASRLGPRCMQTTTKGNPEQMMSEDCLHLNVFTPRKRSSDFLPVMVYVHGGGMNTGCSADFPGYNLADYAGMVVVVIQYRLNVFANWLHDQAEASNLGLHDQVQALRWVQSNARAFGGDPDSVLVSGQSSGCSSVGFHLVYPPSWKLYARAAMMSCAMNDWRPKSMLVAAGTTLAESLGCSNTASVLPCMRAVNASTVFNTLAHTKGLKFQPCYDCLEISQHPLALMREGKVNRGAGVMLGNARWEHGTKMAYSAFGFPNSTVSLRQYEQAVKKVCSQYGNASMAAAAVARYEPLVAKVGYWYALAAMNTHSNVVCGQQYQSTSLASAGVTSLYRYVFTHVTRNWSQRVQNATHTAELPYVFRNAGVLEWFLGYGSFDSQERDLSDRMAIAWSNFARTGNPNSNTRIVSNAETPLAKPPVVDGWQQFDSSGNFTFVLDSSPKPMQDGIEWHNMNERYCSFWEPYDMREHALYI